MAVRHFELRKNKIKLVRKGPTTEPVPFAQKADLQAMVAGWPWIPKTPGLLLGEEQDCIFWHSNNGHRTDLLGTSESGRLVAAEVMLDPFLDRKPAIKRVLRGLFQLDHKSTEGVVFGPFGGQRERPLTAIFVGDGAVFPKDLKQIKKIGKEFRAMLEAPGDALVPPKNDPFWDKPDSKAAAWIGSLRSRAIHFVVVALQRRTTEQQITITCDRLLDISIG